MGALTSSDTHGHPRVKEALGHADLRTTMAYTHLARENLRGLVEQDPRQDEREALKDLA